MGIEAVVPMPIPMSNADIGAAGDVGVGVNIDVRKIVDVDVAGSDIISSEAEMGTGVGTTLDEEDDIL